MAKTLVTGAAIRTGAFIAQALAACGHELVIHYRSNKAEAHKLAERIGAEVIQGDFSHKCGIEAFTAAYLSRFPSTRLLVNNVGLYPMEGIFDFPWQEWERVMNANALLPLALMQGLKETLINNRGQIINIGVVGVDQGVADSRKTCFRSSKRLLLDITRAAAKELGPHGVQVNMLSPGHLENSVDLPEDFSTLPSGRPVKLQELVDAVIWLSQQEQITGQNIEIAGALRL